MLTRKFRLTFLSILLVGVLFSSGCRTKTGITIAGSTSVQPFAEVLAEEYMVLHPGVTINVQGGGSSAGILAVTSGVANIGMSSRELKGDETKLNAIEIARDGLAIIVHPSNPVRNLTLSQIRDIYSRKIKNWSEIGGPNKEIDVVTREEGSGTRSAFVELALGGGAITPTAIVQDSNGAAREVVMGDKAAIGYISLGLVNDKVTPLELDGIASTTDNILNHNYKLWRRFLLLTTGEPTGEAKQFIDFILSTEGQKVLKTEGLVTTSGGRSPQ